MPIELVIYFMHVCRLHCSFLSPAGSSMVGLMMQLLIVSVSHGLYSSGRVDATEEVLATT